MVTISSKPHLAVRLICWALVYSTTLGTTAQVWAKEPAAPPAIADHSANEAESEPAETGGENTKLSPGFMIEMKSPQDQSLSGAFRIQIDGSINLPYSQTVDTKGMTLKMFRAEIRKIYRPYFKDTSTIQVGLKQRRYWVDVRGMVTHPGTFLVRPHAALDEIIALAGGLSEKLAVGFIRVEQPDGAVHWLDLNDYFKSGRIDLPSWQGGDRIFFQKEGPEAGSAGAGTESLRRVQVLGEVKSPGEITFRPDGDAYHYLIKAGGPTTQADLDTVQLVRADPKTGERKPIILGKVYEMKGIKDGDLLIFPSVRQSNSQVTLQTIAVVTGIVTSLALTALLVFRKP